MIFSFLFFDVDQIDLNYYNLFGGLKLVLVNCDKIPSEQEVEIFDSKLLVLLLISSNGNLFLLIGAGTERSHS